MSFLGGPFTSLLVHLTLFDKFSQNAGMAVTLFLQEGYRAQNAGMVVPACSTKGVQCPESPAWQYQQLLRCYVKCHFCSFSKIKFSIVNWIGFLDMAVDRTTQVPN